MHADPLVECLLAKSTWLHRRATRIARDAQAAEDLVQEAWLAALQQRPDLARPLEPWLERVMQNAWAHGRRERLRGAALALEAEGIERAAPELALFDRERRARLLAAIGQLAEPYRTTVRQRFLEERTVGEIAHLSAEPRATVSTRLRRGLERLRRSLEPKQRWLPVFWLARRERPAPDVGSASVAARAWLGWTAACGALLVALGAGDLPGAEAPRDPVLAARSSELGAHAAEDGITPRAARAVSEVPRRALVEPAGTDARSAAAPSASARGRVVWAGSRAPAAGVPALVVLEDGESVECATDQDGVFELPAELAASALGVVFPRAEPSAAPSPSLFLARGAFAGSLELTLGRGPVVRLALEAPPPVEARDLVAVLRTRVPGVLAVAGARLGPGLAPSELAVQLPASDGGIDLPRAGSVCVMTRDGFWAADAALDAAALAGERAIPLEWSARGVLEVAILGPDGAPPAWNNLWVRPAGSAHAWVDAADSASTGRVVAPALAPGEYEVEVDTALFPSWKETLAIEAGVRTRREVVLEPALSHGRVRGELSSETGRYDGVVLLSLSGGEQFPQFCMAEWAATERGFVAAFEFECASETTFELAAVPLGDHRAFAPAGPLAVQTGDEVALVCRDAAPCADLDLRVRTREGLEPAATYVFEIHFADGPSYALRSRAGGAGWGLEHMGMHWTQRSGAALPSVPLGADFRWVLRVGKQILRTGDASAFATGVADFAIEDVPEAGPALAQPKGAEPAPLDPAHREPPDAAPSSSP